MDNKDELQDLEFDLEDILNEFGSGSAPSEEPEEAPQPEPQEAHGPMPPAGEGRVHSLEHTGPMPTLSRSEEPAETPAEAPAETPAEPESSEEAEAPADTETPAEESAEAPADPALKADSTLDADELLSEALNQLEEPEENAEAPLSDDTHRFTPQEEIPPIPAPIPFSTPRSRLKELKKKLVAGPEKRYYALSEAGVGKLQAAILVSALVVLICGAVTTMYVLDMVPENRLRLVIFSQVLAMLISALMGCQLMLDAIAGIFRGRFTLDTLLTVSFFVCLADAYFCLQSLRVPCCAAFCLSMTMALWARYHRHTTEMAQMDTMRKAVRLHGLTKKADYYEGQAGLLQVEGQVEDFMDTYNKPSGPEKLQNFYAFLSLIFCTAISVFAGMRHGMDLAVQILSTSLLVAVPASFFVSISRPAAILEKRLHMVGTVLCGWQGVKGLRGKAVFPLEDTDLFPQGSTKFNGVKFYNDHDPDEVVSCATSLICQAGGGLVPLFQQLLSSRDGVIYPVESFRSYGGGGIGGIVQGQPVLMGDMAFLQDMGIEIPEGTMVSQAVYAAMDGQLCAVFAVSYAKMRSSSAGLVTLCGYRRLKPVMVGSDFMITEDFIRSKFSIKTRRIVFPDPDTRAVLRDAQPDADAPVLALSTREELLGTAYAVTGARALSTATRLGVAIHLIGGILGMLMMLVLAVLGSTELLIPTNILLYQLIWAVPGLLVTEWARAV